MDFKYTFRTNYHGRTFPEVSFERRVHLKPADLSWTNKEYLTVAVINYFNKRIFVIDERKSMCFDYFFHNNYMYKNIMFLF